VHNAVNGVKFIIVLFAAQVVCVESVVEVSDGCVRMLGWLVGGVRNDTVSEGWLPVYAGGPLCCRFVDGDVQEVYFLLDSISTVNFMFG
jgi:hypothetical protein